MTGAGGSPELQDGRAGHEGSLPQPLVLQPAVDIAGGRAAQVVDGSTDDPYDVALRWVDAGAEWIHLVDLDRAFGRGDNARLLERLVRRIPVPVQLSGGLADAACLAWAASTDATHLVLASSALADPDLVAGAVQEHVDRVVVSVDVRDGHVVSRGTSLDLGPVEGVLARHPAVADVGHVLVADASRDGSRRGSDVELFARVAGLVGVDVIASGGAATLDDLRALASLADRGVTHAVIGAALYHGTFTLGRALEVCRMSEGVR